MAQRGASLVAMQQAGGWRSPDMPAHYARQATASRGAVATLRPEGPMGVAEALISGARGRAPQRCREPGLLGRTLGSRDILSHEAMFLSPGCHPGSLL